MTDGAGASATGVDASVRELAGDDELARLWLGALRELGGRAAHELRGALNGVALNLEVVRARALKAGAAGTDVASFAAAAADQLDVLTERTEALVALARAPRAPLDVRLVTRQLVALLAPAMRSTGGTLELVDAAGDAPPLTSAPAECARLALAAVLLAASDGVPAMLCRIAVDDAIIVRVEGPGLAGVLAPDLLRIAADAGIGIALEAEATILAFPAERG